MTYAAFFKDYQALVSALLSESSAQTVESFNICESLAKLEEENPHHAAQDTNVSGATNQPKLAGRANSALQHL